MAFSYDPLSAGHIRLLKHRPSGSGSLSFDIVHVALSSKPHYAALSYTWGSPGDAGNVLIHSQYFPVRQNLFDALQRIYSGKSIVSHLWVDAICINQGIDAAALKERSAQVTLMERIYGQADTVWVWLGKPKNKEDEETNRMAFAKIKYSRERVRVLQKTSDHYQPWWWPTPPRSQGLLFADLLLTFSPATDKSLFDAPGSMTYKAWLGIVSMWNSRWWARTWIYQESTLDDKPNHFFGIRGAQVRPTVLQIFRHTECADVRDKVYAPLGLLPADVSRRIVPDYAGKTHRDVHTDVAEYYLTKPGQPLDFLGYTMHRGGAQASTIQGHTSAFPSWLPDFSHSLDIVPIPKILHVPTNTYRRSRRLDWKRLSVLELDNTFGMPVTLVPTYRPLGGIPPVSFIVSDMLHVRGARIDRLKDFIPNTGPELDRVRAVAREKGRKWAIESQHKYRLGGTYAEAIQRTIVLDLVYDELGRPARRGGSYDSTLRHKPRAECTPVELRAQLDGRIASIRASSCRDLGLSEKLFLVMSPNTAMVGDTIWALTGGQALYVLRPVDVEILPANALLGSASCTATNIVSIIPESIAEAPQAEPIEVLDWTEKRYHTTYATGHDNHSPESPDTPRNLLPSARKKQSTRTSSMGVQLDMLRFPRADSATAAVAKSPRRDVGELPKPQVGSGEVGREPACGNIQATTTGMTNAYQSESAPSARANAPLTGSRKFALFTAEATVSTSPHSVISTALASVKTTWSFDGIFPVLPNKSEREATTSIATTPVYPTPLAMPTLPTSTGHITMGTDFAKGTPLVMPMSMNAIPAVPDGTTAWITVNGGKSLSFITAISSTTALSPSLDLQPALANSTTAATLSQPATPSTPPAQSDLAKTAIANETWMYPPASERFAIAVANPLAVAVVCLIVFAVTKVNTRRHRRRLDFYGPPVVEERRPRMSGADLAGSGMKQLRPRNGDGPGRLDEDVGFEDFMGSPVRKAKPLPQAPGQQLVDAGGVDGEEHVGGDVARQDQASQVDDLDYHTMIRGL
ncbi:hypothetical protein LTS00_006077 [Friedmanniomyces endolithicus]|nr:hypothetical protein LTS00_006077 [Friedmanniomyces endolithicus]